MRGSNSRPSDHENDVLPTAPTWEPLNSKSQAYSNYCTKIDIKYNKNPGYMYHVKSIGKFELLLYTIRNAMFYGCQVISSQKQQGSHK